MADIGKPKYQIPDIPIPPDVRQPGGLAQKIEDSLKRMVVGIFNMMTQPFIQLSNAAMEYVMDSLEEQGIVLIQPFVDEINANPEIPPEYKKLASELTTGQHAFPVVLIVAGLTAMLSVLIYAIAGPFTQRLTLWANKEAEAARPTIADLVRMYWREALTKPDYDTFCAETGWSAGLVEAYEKYLRPLLDINALIEGMHRNFIEPAEVDTFLRKRGYEDYEINLIRKLAVRMVAPADYILFAVREAFDEEVVGKFGHDADYPELFGDFMRKLGYDDDTAKYYWRSHWRLPGAGDGAQMLHREIITPDEYDDLLKTLDYAPFWRDALRKLTYNLLTRVDVRRMYQHGIIASYDELVKIYEKQGYIREDAVKLADLAEALITGSDRELTKSDILGAYTDGLIDRSNALTMLTDLDYGSDEADILLDRIDYKRDKERFTATMRIAEKKFKRGDIDSNGVLAMVGEFNVPESEVSLKIDLWELDMTAKDKMPTLSQLQSLLKSGVINEQEFMNEGANLEYAAKYLEWFAQQAKTTEV